MARLVDAIDIPLSARRASRRAPVARGDAVQAGA